MVRLRAPYFGSISARFTEIKSGHVELRLPHHRRVTNHLGAIHAIALCNGLEALAAMLATTSLPADVRWIPVGMDVRYTAQAHNDLTCIADLTGPIDVFQRELSVAVHAITDDGVTVIEGSVRMKVSTPKPREESLDALRNVR